jgi:hypothetical protein
MMASARINGTQVFKKKEFRGGIGCGEVKEGDDDVELAQ